uniref:G-protein coupled receptors family 1 profile domain-containing protein n=2 Tax=Anser cygnoides TaxID=8845 RepID=A0A8B9DSY2_ANSCY
MLLFSLSFLVSHRRGCKRDKVATRSRSFTMAETSTTDLSLSYTIFQYLDSFENNTHICLRLSYESLVFLGVCMGISLCGLAVNGIVIWFLFSHMRNPFAVYILNLAVADFALLLFSFLLMLAILILTICSLFDYIILSYIELEIIVGFLCHFFDLSSLGLLTAISVDRCVSVFFPIWYRCHRPKHLSGIVSGLLWVLAGSFVSSMYLSFYFVKRYGDAFGGIAIAITVTLSSMMLISNLSLFIKLRCGFQRRHPGKLYVAVLLNVIFFFVFAIPFSVEVFFNLPRTQELFPDKVSFLLALLNSSTNPIIYFLVGSCRRRRIQGSVKAAFRRVFEENAVSEEGSRTPRDMASETTV